MSLELLDRGLFFKLREVNAATSNYAYEYNFKQPHGSLGKRPPAWPRITNFRTGLWPAPPFALAMFR